MKRIAIIGSTGSIGKQAVEIMKNHTDLFQCVALIADSNVELIRKQKEELGAQVCGLFSRFEDGFLYGEECYKVCSRDDVDLVLLASSGIATLPYFLEAIKSSKIIASANKECIVSCGDLLFPLIKEYNAILLPVDSEHSAIFQSLRAGEKKNVKRLILTASGGPFFGKNKEELAKVTKKDALNHPTWNMGNKITIDSATLMNKALEVIEAVRLFDMPEDKVDVVVHRESIVHSLVEFDDNAIVCEMSYPTMEIPIQLALTYPERYSTSVSSMDFDKLGNLSFYPLDKDVFPFIELGRKVLRMGGFYPCIFSASNEVAVEAFLNDKIKFNEIFDVVYKTIENSKFDKAYSLDNIYDCVKYAKDLAEDFIGKKC